MPETREGGSRILFVGALATILLAFSVLRVRAYGNLRGSVGTNDTPNFVRASRLPIGSLDFYTSNRPPTIALVYKLLRPQGGYDLEQVSDWATTGTRDKKVQEGFDRIVLFQTVLSMIGWTALAVGFGRRLRSSLGKLLGMGLILAFGYSPQVAEWDSALMSEPISFALFALLLGLSLELASRFAQPPEKWSWSVYPLAGGWILTLALWVFSRDSNTYALLAGIAVLALVAFWQWRQGAGWRRFVAAGVLMACLFGLHNLSLNNSDRWENPFFNNLIYHVLPYPERVEFFEDHGMPVTDELLSLAESRGNERRFLHMEEFMDWTRQRGPSTYTRFLLSHPGWTISTLLDDLGQLFSENSQTYLRTRPSRPYLALKWIGNILHPESSLVAFLAIMLALAFCVPAVQSPSSDYRALGWIFFWLLMAAGAMLFVSYHGDAISVIRHALVATMPLRLSLWMLGAALVDMALVSALNRLSGSSGSRVALGIGED